MKNRDEAAEAISYSYRLLAIRPRSEKEVRDRLVRKRFSSRAVSGAISVLKEKSLIDDLKFARLWVESRMNRNPRGTRLLKKELRTKGVAWPAIEQVLADTKADDAPLAQALAEAKLPGLKALPLPAAKRKLFGFLARRGFDYSTIQGVIEQVFN